MEITFSKEDLEWLSSHVPAWKIRIKRGFDLFFSIFALVLLSGLFFAIALIVKMTSRGPLFFVQERVGHKGNPFKIYKFRTMVENALLLSGYETNQHDPRITWVGAFLRRWSLDELPQLWNVFKGEMSFVGPRPTLAYQVKSYSNRQKRRLLVKPGLTGWAQIHGRNELQWPEKIELDLEYIENFSLGRDIQILFKTSSLVFSGRGVW